MLWDAISKYCIHYSRKEVIQPQVHLRLPCYDFTPVAASAVDGSQFSIPA